MRKPDITEKRLIIIGASGHGKVAVDIACYYGYKGISFLDDDESVKFCLGYPVVGIIADAEKYSGFDFFVAIGNSKIRENVQNQLITKKLKIATLIHPNAVIAPDVVIGVGSIVMAGTVINPGSTIGIGCIVNTGATVDHDNALEDYVHVSVGSHLAGTVSIGKSTFVGAGAIISNNITICSDCVIGAGTVVTKDIRETGVYIGVPAKRIK